MASNRTPGCDLDDEQSANIFDSHIKMAHCTPNELWKLKSVTKCGHTSDWASVKRSYDELHSILIASGGLIPHQLSLNKQFKKWLVDKGLHWTPSEADRCVLNLRMMLSTLLDRKRREQDAPRNYGQLQILMDMMKLVSKNDDGKRRLSYKQDVPTVVPLQKKQAIVLEISDDDVQESACVEDEVEQEDAKTEHSDSDLESKLFKPKPSTTTAPSSSKALTASDLAALASGPSLGPSPQEYAEAFKSNKGKKASVPYHSSEDEGDGQEGQGVQATAKSKSKAKTKGRGRGVENGKSKAPMKAKDGDVDWIANYVGIKGVSMPVLRNRVYSKAHAMEKKYRLDMEWSRPRALESAVKYANKMVKRWQEAMGVDKK